MIRQINVKSFEQAQDSKNKPFVQYQIEVVTSTRIWSVWRRYSEFEALIKRISGYNIPKLPPKSSLFSPFSTSNVISEKSFGQLEERRVGLDSFMKVLLSQVPEDNALMQFLDVDEQQHSRRNSKIGGNFDGEVQVIQVQIREVRQMLSSYERDQNESKPVVKKRKHEGQDVDVVNESRKLLSGVSIKLKRFNDQCKDFAFVQKNNLSDKEVLRRQDVLESLVVEKDQLLGQIRTLKSQPVQSQERSQLLESGSYRNTPATSRRVIGQDVSQKDNEQLFDHSNQLMQSQDSQLDILLNSVRRQRQIGLAINDELQIQNEVLNKLDEGVDRTQQRVKGMSGQLKKLT